MSKTAYPGTRSNVFMCNPDDLTIIGIDTDDGPEHPLYQERIHLPLDAAIVANIKHYGVKLGIIVKKLFHERLQKSLNVVVDGRQRLRMLREANRQLKAEKKPLLLIKCAPEATSDLGELEEIAEVANIHIPDDVVTKAKVAAKHVAKGMAKADVARMLGKTTRQLATWLNLASLDEQVLAHVVKGQLSMADAVTLTGLEVPEQRERAKALLNAAPKEEPAGAVAGPAVKQRKLSLREKVKRIVADAKAKKKIAKVEPFIVLDWIIASDDADFLKELGLPADYFQQEAAPEPEAETTKF